MSRSSPRLAALAPLPLALLLAGCAQDFVPGSVVADRRILALVAEPPELDGTGPGAATVRAVEAQPPVPPALRPGAALERRWSVCPFTLGPRAGYACAVPACEAPLAPDAGGAVSVSGASLGALVAACLATPGVTPPPGIGPGSLPEVVEVLVRYRLVDAAPGLPELVLREAVQRLPVWTVAPTRPLNLSPGFAATPLLVDGLPAAPCLTPTGAGVADCPVAGTLSAAAPLAVEAAVDPDTIEDYAIGTRVTTEVFALSFFTTEGRFDFDTGRATREVPTAGVVLKHEAVTPGATDLLLWVALRDLRGGEAVAGPYRVAVAP